MSGAAQAASVPFIGFISERQLREREERESEYRSMSLVAGSPGGAPQPHPPAAQAPPPQISWAEAWEKSAAAAEPLDPAPATVLASASVFA